MTAGMQSPSRRRFLRDASLWASLAAVGLGGCARPGRGRGGTGGGGGLAVATFAADVTVPLGHALMGGGILPAREIVDPLWARGVVLWGGGSPVVLVAVDWCEIRNEAHARWRAVLAEAAGTDPSRVLVSSVHVHDAPVADLEAERILRARGAAGSVCDLDFHERAVQRVAAAVRGCVASRQPVTHVGHGLAPVTQVASNRRFHRPDGSLSFGRTSATRDPVAHAAELGTIDSNLRTLSLWRGDRPLVAIHAYATHPMSYYGRGGVSADFVGMARARRQADDPGVFQVYASGCSGNVTAGRHNDGAAENRPVLAGRIHEAMVAAWGRQERHPARGLEFRSVPFQLEPRGGAFTAEALEKRLATERAPFGQCLAAMGLSWRRRVAAGVPLDLPVIDFGSAQLLLLPAEAYVEYQLHAQRVAAELRADAGTATGFVMTLGYGECAPGYIPTEQAWAEGDGNLGDWCWVAPGAEAVLKGAIRTALAGRRG